MSIIHDYLINNNDRYAPNVSIPSLQQWDNYQIHDLYCEDIAYDSLLVGGNTFITPNATILFKKFVAVEKASPLGEIYCDFEAIAIAYP